MFRFVKRPAHWWPVRWKSAIDDGRVQENAIRMQLVRIGVEEFQAGWGTPPAEGRREEWTAWFQARVKECAKAWDDIVDENGSKVPFDDEHVALFMDQPNARQGFQDAYLEFWRAEADVALGNSDASPGGGVATTDAAAAATATTALTSKPS